MSGLDICIPEFSPETAARLEAEIEKRKMAELLLQKDMEPFEVVIESSPSDEHNPGDVNA